MGGGGAANPTVERTETARAWFRALTFIGVRRSRTGMTSDKHRRIELLRLRRAQLPPSPILRFNSPLVQKGGGKGRKQEAELVQQIEEELGRLKWVAPPRAKM